MLLAAAPAPQEQTLTPVHFKAPEFPEAGLRSSQTEGAGGGLSTAAPGGPRGGRVPNPPGSPDTGDEGDAFAPVVTWINSRPLSMANLRGNVVLIDFWEYTCINCIRTFEENKKWYERYHKYGFEIVGVHDPEFDIAFPAEHVRAAVKRFGLPYPIVVDNGRQIWSAYKNSTWPNRFLIDAQGTVRFNRSGEGADRAFEVAIQQLLKESYPDRAFPAGYTLPPEENAFAPACGALTPEMYVGDWFERGILANPEGYHKGKTVNYSIAGGVKDGAAMVSGAWETERNGMIYRGKHKKGSSGDDKLEMSYHARELYAVLNVARGRPSRLFIQQDGKDLTTENKGVDVQIGSDGRSYLDVREPRMYYLVQNPAFGQHTVTLAPTAPGLSVNSFTFGNNCQTKFPHL